MKRKQITRNAARCLGCGDEIESKHVYDFQQCSCGALFVDGGHEYIRRGMIPGAHYEELSQCVEGDCDE